MENRGITLIALVITIIVLLILATVTISALTGNNGLLNRISQAKIEANKSQIEENIQLAKFELRFENMLEETEKLKKIEDLLHEKYSLENIGKMQTSIKEDLYGEEYLLLEVGKDYVYKITVDLNQYLGTLDDISMPNVNVSIGSIEFIYTPTTWTNGNVIVTMEIINEEYKQYNIEYSLDGKQWRKYDPEGIEFSSNGSIYARLSNSIQSTNTYATGNVTTIERTKPIITETVGGTDTIKIVATDELSGIIGYAVTQDSNEPSDFTSCENTKTLNATATGVNQSTSYYVWVKDAAGNISKGYNTSTGMVEGLTSANTQFQYSSQTWTNGSVTVTASTTIKGYTLQTSKDGENWESTASQTFTENGTIYARLADSSGQFNGYATGNVTIIDKQSPTATISKTSSIVAGNSLSATVTLTDSGGSGINLSKSKWIFNYQSSAIGTTSSSYTGGTFSSTSQTVTRSRLTTTGNCYLHVLVTDNAGNAKEYISTATTVSAYTYSRTFEYTGSVQSVTIPKSGYYTIQTYGASGGTSILGGVTRYGGQGGYSRGRIYLSQGTVLYFYVGGSGGSYYSDATSETGGWNGGGTLSQGQSLYGAPGGGATDVRLVRATSGSWYTTSHSSWASDASLLSRIMVAGGGRWSLY